MVTEKIQDTDLDLRERLAPGKKILVFGASGMVGSRFCELFGGENFRAPGNREVDITNKEAVKAYIEREKPDFIINFAAFTDVNKAKEEGLKENRKELPCWRINVDGVQNILDAIDPEKTHFIQISTDMVFSGSMGNPGPYKENQLAETDPDRLTWYGFTKAEAERRVLEKLGPRAIIVRIIYPVTDHYDLKLDYLRAPLAKFRESGKLYPLFNDQHVNITDVDDVAETLKVIVEKSLSGTFHVASSDFSTPHDIISAFLSQVQGMDIDLEQREMGEMAGRYPQFGGLKTEETRRKTGVASRTIFQIIEKLVRRGVGSQFLPKF